MLTFEPAFPLCHFTVIKGFFSSPSLFAVKIISSDIVYMSFAVLITACGPARYFTGCALYRSYISRMTMYSFLNFQPVCCSMSGSVASWPAYRFLKREIKWPGIPISKNFPQFIVIHTVKGFNVVDKTEVDVFLELPCVLHDPWMLAIWSLILLCNPACTSESSWFTYWWSLVWGVLSIMLLTCEMNAFGQ